MQQNMHPHESAGIPLRIFLVTMGVAGVCNIAETAPPPREAARETITIIREMVGKSVNGSRRFDSA